MNENHLKIKQIHKILILAYILYKHVPEECYYFLSMLLNFQKV